MNSNYLQGKIGRALLAFSLLFGIAFLSSTTTQAQYGRDDQYRRDRDRDDDHDRNRDRDWRRRNRDRDRDRDWGRDRRDNRYGRNGGYGNGDYGYNNGFRIAQTQGYQDGLYTGSNDAQRGQGYNPQRSHFYRNGHSDNNSYYGNNGQFQQAYRQGFLSGYNAGYSRYGGYNNGGYNRRNGRRFPY